MSSENAMTVAGMSVGLHVPKASRSRMEGSQEASLQLPPYAPRQVYDLAKFPSAPGEWVRAENPGEASYFFGIPEDNGRDGYGMWLDLRGLESDPMEVAALVSMQGVNLLTLQEFSGDDARTLHWYRDGMPCPIHPHVKFVNGLFCQSCGHKWPKVNFLSTTGAKADNATLWVDGPYEGPDTVRQFWFVHGESGRGVAQNLIGDRRSQGMGILFYRSLAPKPVHGSRPRQMSHDAPAYRSFLGAAPEIAAGARITQRIGVDPNGREFWHPHPMGILRIYFDWQSEIDKILSRDQAGSGPLSGRSFQVGTN